MIFILSIWAPRKYFYFLENLISSLSQKVGKAKWHGDMVIFLLVSRKYDAKVNTKLRWIICPMTLAFTSSIYRCEHIKLFQACLTLRHPVDCSPSGSSVHGIL